MPDAQQPGHQYGLTANLRQSRGTWFAREGGYQPSPDPETDDRRPAAGTRGEGAEVEGMVAFTGTGAATARGPFPVAVQSRRLLSDRVQTR